jgi:hypothetical protein
MNQLYHFLILFQYSRGKFYLLSLFFLLRYYKARIRVGGLPSFKSFSINLGQLHSYYLSWPLFCYLGIQPLSSMVSSQLLMTFSVSCSSFLTVTSQWKPSSQRNPQGKRFRDGEKLSNPCGELATVLVLSFILRLPY